MKKKMILSEEREITTISINMPSEVIRDLKHAAMSKGMSDYQALIKFYVGQGLRKDIAELQRKAPAEQAKKILGKYKIDSKIIDEVVAAVSQ